MIRRRALVFGGAFNPPTRAHIELAQDAMQQSGYERVIFVPSKETYIEGDQKKNFAFDDRERLHMLRKISIDRPWMEVSTYELDSSQQPRTYQTLTYLKTQGYDCRLLMGSDKLKELETGWKHVPEICREFGIAVISRGNDDVMQILDENSYLRALRQYITVIRPTVNYRMVSSTQVREQYEDVIEGISRLQELVPDELDGLRSYLPLKGKA